MKHLILFGLCSVLTVTVVSSARAVVLKTIDQTKQADVNGKVFNTNVLNFNEVAQPTRSFSQSPRSSERQSFPVIQMKNADLQQLSRQPTTVSTPILPQQNFTAKRAAIPDQRRYDKQFPVTKAPIKDRVLRPFAPGGEEELKKQLNEPH